MALENKCGYKNRKPAPYGKFPAYYYPQCQLHMLATNTRSVILCGWSPDTTEFWEVKYDEEYWKLVLPEFVYFSLCGRYFKRPPDKRVRSGFFTTYAFPKRAKD